MQNAYMIRNDGKLFPVTVHWYGNKDVGDVEETISASEWLYDATNHADVRSAIEKLLAAYAFYLDPDLEPDEIADTLEYQFKHVGYHVISNEFIERLMPAFEKMDLKSIPPLQTLNTIVNQELNQEFLRARYGGMYDTDHPSGKEMYFRISSVGFNWFDIMWEFVEKNRSQIDYVTVVKDPEATGMDGYVYMLDGKPVQSMPADEFIFAKGSPVMDSVEGFGKKESIQSSLKDMNSLRRNSKIFKMHVRDSVDNCIYANESFAREN